MITVDEVKMWLKKFFKLLGYLIAIGAIFAMGWLASNHHQLALRAKRAKYLALVPGLNKSITRFNLGLSANKPRFNSLKPEPKLNMAKPILVQKITLTKDPSNSFYYLVFTLDRLPKLYVYSDSKHPYGIKFYNTFIKDATLFNNLKDSPVEKLTWKPVKNHLEFTLSLKKDCYLVQVDSKVINSSDGDQVAENAKAKALKVSAKPVKHEAELKFKIIKTTSQIDNENSNSAAFVSQEMLIDQSEDGSLMQAAKFESSSYINHKGNFENNDSVSAPKNARNFKVDTKNIKNLKHQGLVARPTSYTLSAEEKLALAMQQAEANIANNEFDLAINKLNEALYRFGARSDASIMLASLLLEMNQAAEAEQVIDRALKVASRDILLNELKAKLLMKRGRVQMARERLLKIVALTDLRMADTAGLALLGMADYQLGEFKEASLIYNELARREPNNAAWWLGLGLNLEELGKFSAAFEAYRAGLKNEGVPLETRELLMERLKGLAKKR